jgi:hypothetical protein
VEQLLEVGIAVNCVLLMWDGDAVPLSKSGDKALFVTGNVLFDVTLAMFGQVMVDEQVILVQSAENELAEVVAVVVEETTVFVLVPDSVALLLDVL